jgi:predicted transcriptional regulator
MNVILSIHPKWAKLIYEGKKTLEWRKNTPNADFIDKVFLYETAPVKKITGCFMYDHYYSLVFGVTKDGKPADGAEVLIDRGCVPLDELKKYAGRKKEIFGWKFYKVRKFDSPKSLEDFGLTRPPQSWCYTEVNV